MTEPTHTETPAADAEASATPSDPHAGLLEARDRYRAERDSAREELAAATERIARMQRAEVERLASAHLSHPEDLLTLSGNDVTDYLTESGDIDPEKVAADVEAILAERPGLKPPSAAVDRSQGLGGSAESMPKDFSAFFSG